MKISLNMRKTQSLSGISTGLTCLFRFVLQDPRDLSDGVLRQVHGPVHVFHLHVQHRHEDLLHYFHCLHHLHDAILETLLHRKSLFTTHFCFRPTIASEMTSLTSRSFFQLQLFSPASCSPDGLPGNWPGVTVCGWRVWRSSPRS